MTKDVNPLSAKVLEYKFYARGIGPVWRSPSPAAAIARSS